MSPRPKNPPPDRRAEILDAALRLFAEKGYAEATNAEIAKEAGVTAAALYYYFPSKEELFRAAVRQHIGRFVPTLRALTVQAPADASGPEAVGMILRNALAFFTEEKTQLVLRIVLAEGPRRPEIRQIWIDQITGIFELLAPFVMNAIASGQIRPIDPRLIFVLLQGPMLSTVIIRDLLQVPALEGLTNDAVVDAVLETTLAGLRSDG
ncbi:MAG: TetR/AcrR family transcriptional regulator [Symbiobacterium sp.]|uniref:TetR/AcrR family transcriptional regulator n=1 Tax=Symbiobacterium sp. TaxID=1971213 RepID=UPI0034640497